MWDVGVDEREVFLTPFLMENTIPLSRMEVLMVMGTVWIVKVEEVEILAVYICCSILGYVGFTWVCTTYKIQTPTEIRGLR